MKTKSTELMVMLARELMCENFTEEVREKVLDEACREYRERISPMVDECLQMVVDARVDVIRNQNENFDEMNINIVLEDNRENQTSTTQS